MSCCGKPHLPIKYITIYNYDFTILVENFKAQEKHVETILYRLPLQLGIYFVKDGAQWYRYNGYTKKIETLQSSPLPIAVAKEEINANRKTKNTQPVVETREEEPWRSVSSGPSKSNSE